MPTKPQSKPAKLKAPVKHSTPVSEDSAAKFTLKTSLMFDEKGHPIFGKNTTAAQLADELGACREVLKRFQTLEGQLKTALTARWPEKSSKVEGEKFTAIKTPRERTGLDSDRIKSEMGKKWVDEHSKTTEYEEIRCTKNAT